MPSRGWAGGRAAGPPGAGLDGLADAGGSALATGEARCGHHRLQVLPHPLAPAFAPEAGFAVAAEPRRGVEAIRAVHPHRPGLDRRRHVKRQAQILRPDAGSQPEAGVVGERHGLGGGAESQTHQDGSEDLLGDDGARHGRPGAQRRRQKEPVLGQRPRRLPDRRPVGLARLQIALDAVKLAAVDDRAHVDRLVQGMAEPDRLHPGSEAVVHLALHALLNQEPRPGATHLALVEPDPVHHAFDGRVEVGALENHEGRLPAELQRQVLARPGGGAPDLASHLGRARERDLRDARMTHQGRPRRPVPRHHVQHAGRQSGLVRHLGEEQRRQGGVFGRLEHDRVPGGQGGRHLPRQHEQREIPGDDLAHDTDRLVVRKLGRDQLGPASVVVEVPCGERDVQVTRLADRLAVVQGLHHREMAGPLLDLPGDAVEMPGPCMATDFPPAGQGVRGRRDRLIHVVAGAVAEARQEPVVGRTSGLVQGTAAVGPAPADVVAESALAVPQPLGGEPVALGGGSVAWIQEGVADAGLRGFADAGHGGLLLSLGGDGGTPNSGR